jgi:hypothetical protein
LGVPSPFRALVALLVAVAVTGVAVAAGVALRSPDETETTTRPLAARLASIDTTTSVVRRGPFCSAVPAADVRAAVDDTSPQGRTWANGEPLGTAKDVAHEYGCAWTAASGAVASAWVFAPPVTVQRGQELVRSARSTKGCSPLTGAATFGSPSVALSCASGGTTTLSYRGLFGDAWLVCQLAVPTAGAAAASDLADRWCASVLTAAGPQPTAD